jgi:hypothetical protein
MGTQGAGVTAGVVNALALGAAMGASGAGTTAGVVAALELGAAISDGGVDLIVGSFTFVDVSTSVDISTITAAPDFILAWHATTVASTTVVKTTVNTTTITFESKTAGTGNMYYLLGYTA